MDDLEAALAASHVAPVILFKHSETCGVSLMARDGLADEPLPAPVHEVVVQRQRPVSNAMAERLGVRHESPQVFVVAGVDAWHDAVASRAPVVMPLRTQPYGMREFAVTDPDGHVITFAERIG